MEENLEEKDEHFTIQTYDGLQIFLNKSGNITLAQISHFAQDQCIVEIRISDVRLVIKELSRLAGFS